MRAVTRRAASVRATRCLRGALFVAAAALLPPALAIAQSTAIASRTAGSSYPTKSVRLVVPFAAGGPVDIVARGIAPRMSELLGQPLVVDNRGGAGSVIGTEMVATAAPDGYTLAMVSGSFVINPALVKKLPYDSLRGFSFITIVADVPSGLAVTAALPAKSLKEFIALAKAKPGELNYASPGRGTLGHLAAAWFSARAGVTMTHVPYKGAGPALVDVMAGQVQLLFAALPGMVPVAREGRVRILAQGGAMRSSSLPEVPTFAEAGLPDFQLSSNFGLLGPAAMPLPVITRLQQAAVQALAEGGVRGRLAAVGADVVGSTPAEHERFSRAEIVKWTAVARAAGIQPE